MAMTEPSPPASPPTSLEDEGPPASSPSVPDQGGPPAGANGDEAPFPRNLAEAALKAAIGEVDYRSEGPDGERVPISPQPADRDSWQMGAEAGIRAFLRLVPSPDPTAVAIEQLWVHQRAIVQQLNLVTTHTARMVAKLEEYEAVLPAPDSIMARAGKWGRRRTFDAG